MIKIRNGIIFDFYTGLPQPASPPIHSWGGGGYDSDIPPILMQIKLLSVRTCTILTTPQHIQHSSTNDVSDQTIQRPVGSWIGLLEQNNVNVNGSILLRDSCPFDYIASHMPLMLVRTAKMSSVTSIVQVSCVEHVRKVSVLSWEVQNASPAQTSTFYCSFHLHWLDCCLSSS